MKKGNHTSHETPPRKSAPYSGEGDEMKVLEDGVLGPQPKECGSQQKLGKARNTFAPGASRGSMARPAP